MQTATTNRIWSVLWVFLCAVASLATGAISADAGQIAGGFGWDDFNFVGLNPYVDGAPQFVLDSSWLNKDQALGHGLDPGTGTVIDERNFVNTDLWRFPFAEDKTVIFPDRFQYIIYNPCVVSDPGVPGRAPTIAPTHNPDQGDVGGVDFSFVYTPKKGEVGFGNLDNVHFLQLIKTASIYLDEGTGLVSNSTRYFFDNLGNQNIPFADQVGGNSKLPNGSIVTNDDGTKGKYFYDIPDRCEPKPYGYGVPPPTCMTDEDPSLIVINWAAQTFVALTKVVGALTEVTLYGGPSWGFTYVNVDCALPAPRLEVAASASPVCADFGDAPDSYQTLLTSNGPRYVEGDLQRLGEKWDSESDGQPTLLADGDDLSIGHSNCGCPVDDEDGVVFGSNFVDVTWNITRPGLNDYLLRAWSDLNDNGTFDHTSELLIDEVRTLDGGSSYTYRYGFDPNHYSRFRLTWMDDPAGWLEASTGLTTTDIKPFDQYISLHDGISHGEVEDYARVPEPSSWLLMGTGLLGLLGYGWRRRKQARPGLLGCVVRRAISAEVLRPDDTASTISFCCSVVIFGFRPGTRPFVFAQRLADSAAPKWLPAAAKSPLIFP